MLSILVHLFPEDRLFSPGQLPVTPDIWWTEECVIRERVEPFKISVSDADLIQNFKNFSKLALLLILALINKYNNNNINKI